MSYQCQLCRDSGWINEKVSNETTAKIYGPGKKIEYAKECPNCYPRVLMTPAAYEKWCAKYRGEAK